MDNASVIQIKMDGNVHPKVRQSNIELMRIIVMLTIVAHHFVVNSGLTSQNGPIAANPTSLRSLFLLLFGMWGKSGINCFVMVTGYFMCKSRITLKKFAKLTFEWLFYRYVFFLVFLVTGYLSLNMETLLDNVVPISGINKNFTGCFVMFWLCIPFLNTLIANLTDRQHRYLLMLSAAIYVFFGTFHKVVFNYVSWFCVLYFFASYVRLHPKGWMNRNDICAPTLLCLLVLSMASVMLCARSGRSFYYFVQDSNTLLAFLVGFFCFLFFRNLQVPYNKVINTVAASTFGVLCIHANSDAMRRWLWKDTIDCVGHYGGRFMPLYAIGSVLGVFFVCVAIDILRIHLIEKPFFRWWDRHDDSWTSKIRVP